MIRKVERSDAEAICGIYNYYVVNTIVTFEDTPVTVQAMAARIGRVMQRYPWLVYEEDGRVLGYTYASEWKKRSAYRHTVETGTYVDFNHIGKGIGSRLKGELLQILKATSIHAALSGISLPNPASIALNEKFGFKKVGQLREVGYKFDKWIDVGYWELIMDGGNGVAL